MEVKFIDIADITISGTNPRVIGNIWQNPELLEAEL